MALTITPNADFTKVIVNKSMPFFASSGNANMPVQSGIWGSRIMQWGSNGNAAGNVYGIGQGMSSAGGTFSNPIQATTNLYTVQYRGAYATVVTTANQQVGVAAQNAATHLRGGTAGQGGFLFVCRFGTEAWTAGDRLFVGLSAITTALCTGQPSAVVNMCGFGIDAADTAITFMHNDGSGTATKDTIAGQPTLAALQGYDAYIFCKPNDSVVYYRLDDANAGTTIIDSSTATDLPANTTFLRLAAVMGNAANTPVTAAQIGVSQVYCEVDR